VGPLANSPMGQQVGIWFRKIGALGRTISILSFAVVVLIVSGRINVSNKIVTSVVGGFMISLFFCLLLYILYSGKISGWKSQVSRHFPVAVSYQILDASSVLHISIPT
jgi:hypothetical protein